MSTTTNLDTRIGRRGLLRGLGLAGLGATLFQGLEPRVARASMSPTPGSKPTTSILDAAADQALLTTGPFQTFAAPAGARIGACLLLGGAGQAGGMRPLIHAISAAHTNLDGLGAFTADPGVERGVYRMLAGFDVERPVELFGVSAEAADGLEAGNHLEITWVADVRRGGAGELRQQLDRFHACVFAELSPESTFTGNLSYVEISRR